jgi:hypothetical protein
MSGQFFVLPEEDDPVEPVDGVVLVDPDVPLVLEVPVLVLGVVVAALATTAPPAMRPLVSAPTATTLRTRSFMRCCSFRLM